MTTGGHPPPISAEVFSSDIRERPGEKMNWSNYFTYDPKLGLLRWKQRPADIDDSAAKIRSWNKRYAGKEAGTTRTDGYIAVEIVFLKRKIKAHRIIWEMHNGPIPDGLVIDHINRNRSDNRLENLRVVTRRDNFLNSERFDGKPLPPIKTDEHRTFKKQRTHAKGTSKLKVSRPKPWSAKIWVDGRNVSLGYYATESEASAAYQAAVAKYRNN
ncbi:HNH endonuclease [Enterobacter hormaechei]|uniref:HNH endonuclease signature motif containing protein n=1 Tax=Enterobacter hormaechei TaxID=158836 RepID=UPI0015E5120E|nr:HNH endonuclease signature motif containing protein [Enterobacter hormaechei]QLP02863.1 HNH endonuclease [Enterobacter hormaechei]